MIFSCFSIRERNIVHRDFTLGNVMINDSFEPVLIDFAFGCIYNKNGRLNDLVGTLPYIASEILEVMLYQLLKGQIPFTKASLDDKKFIENDEIEHDGIKLAKKMMNLKPS